MLSIRETVPFIGQVFIRDSLYVDLVTGPQGVQGRGRNQTKPSWGRVMSPPAYALLGWLRWYRVHLQCRRPKFYPRVEDPLKEETGTHSDIS